MSDSAEPTVTADVELTVIVTAHNRADLIAQTLASLAEQTWPDGTWNILLVDNDSTDDTPAILQHWATTMPVPTTIITAKERHNPSYARNTGTAHTNATNIAFIDDDDLIAPGWVAAIGTALRTHQLVGSRFDYHHLNDPEVADHRGSYQTTELGMHFGVPVVSSGGVGCGRDLWVTLRGQSETLGRGSEDIDFALRANIHGVTPRLCNEAVYRVRLRRGARTAFVQGRHFAQSDVRLLAIHGQTFAARPEPASKVIRRWGGLLIRLPSLRSAGPRRLWCWQLGQRIGHLQASTAERYKVK